MQRDTSYWIPPHHAPQKKGENWCGKAKPKLGKLEGYSKIVWSRSFEKIFNFPLSTLVCTKMSGTYFEEQKNASIFLANVFRDLFWHLSSKLLLQLPHPNDRLQNT